MQRLELHYDQLMKGEFSLKELNFLFVFQVNCPGCFIYGIPTVNSLYQEFSSKLSFLGMSTAFEDYDFNTKDNTKRLLNTGEIVGETKRYFAKQSYNKFPVDIDFPVAMDAIGDDKFDLNQAALKICKTNPSFDQWPKFEQDQLHENVVQYLKSQEKVSLTFTLNQMRGTPTFIVFNSDMEILSHHFGHQSIGQLKLELEGFLFTK